MIVGIPYSPTICSIVPNSHSSTVDTHAISNTIPKIVMIDATVATANMISATTRRNLNQSATKRLIASTILTALAIASALRLSFVSEPPFDFASARKRLRRMYDIIATSIVPWSVWNRLTYLFLLVCCERTLSISVTFTESLTSTLFSLSSRYRAGIALTLYRFSRSMRQPLS